jgi:hypothetical protein
LILITISESRAYDVPKEAINWDQPKAKAKTRRSQGTKDNLDRKNIHESVKKRTSKVPARKYLYISDYKTASEIAELSDSRTS